MKHILLTLMVTCTISFAFSQSDTSQTTLHADANTAYFDETGAKIDLIKFMQAMGGGGYTMQPLVQDGHIKRLQLKKVEDKVSTGSIAPRFSITAINGQVFSLKKLRGKTVVLNFWFTNCPGCIKEMPALNNLAGRYKNNADVVFLAVTFDEVQKVRPFLKKHKFGYQIAAGQAAMIRQYGVQAFPFSMVIDKTGRIAFSDNSGLADIAAQLGNVINTVSK